jgi:NAD(P)H dehydrogenase (quinone)
MPTVAIVYYSAQGHTHQIAEAVAEGAKSVPGTTVEVHRIADADIQNGRFGNKALLDRLGTADAIIFGTPTYMGGVASQVKAFIDATGGIWFAQGWRDKVAAGFTHSQGLSGDKLNTLNGLYINALQHGMIWVGTGANPEGSTPDKFNRISSFSGVMAQTDYGQEKVNEGDVKTAKHLGKRVAEATARWVRGNA